MPQQALMLPVNFTHLAETDTHGRRLSVQLGGTVVNVSALARELDMDQSYLSKILLGHIHPTIPTGKKIAKALGVSIGQLIDFIDARRRND